MPNSTTEITQTAITAEMTSEATSTENESVTVNENTEITVVLDYPVDSETVSMQDNTEINATPDYQVDIQVSDEIEAVITLPDEKEIVTEEIIIETTATEMITLPVEEEIVTEATTTVITVGTEQPSTNSAAAVQMIVIISLALIAIVGVLIGMKFIPKLLKREKTAVDDTTSARYRDKQRLQEENEKQNSKKIKKKKEPRIVKKDVLSSMPYQKVLKHNVFLIEKNLFSKAYVFDDVNFNLADEDEQYDYLDRYINFLNVLDDTVDAQICVWNSKINIDDFEESVLIKGAGDKYREYMYEYNTRVLKENIQRGQNAIKKRMCITLTIKAADEETAYERFKSLDIATIDTFNQVGATHMRAMTSQERVQMLAEYYHGADVQLPEFDRDDYKNCKEMTYCCPDYFEFKPGYGCGQ